MRLSRNTAARPARSAIQNPFRSWRRATPALAAALALSALPLGGHANEAIGSPAVSSPPPSLEPDWLEAVRLEYSGQFRAAGDAYERLLAKEPDRAEAAWRAARAYWQFGEEVTPEAFEEAAEWFERADALAAKGLLADPRCGECALWKYASMGRLVEHRGSLWAARHASDLRDLLELGIAARPSHRDPDGNSTLANLYYSSAIFYRMVPEWFWLPLVVGVKGDTERALADIQLALEISGDRVDYHVEHGAVLLCRAKREHDKLAGKAGVRVLEKAIKMAPKQSSDVIDLRYAELLIQDPSGACGFTRQGFLDVEAMAGNVGLGR